MNAQIFFLLFMLGTTHSLLAQSTTDTTKFNVNVVAYWKKNEQKKYRYKFNEMKFEGDSLKSDENMMDIEVIVTVKDSTESAYDMEWKYGKDLMVSESKEHDVAEALSEELVDLMNKYQDFAVRWRTDEFGLFQEYQNAAQVDTFFTDIASYTQKLASEVLKTDLQSKLKPDEINKLKGYLGLLASKSLLADKLLYLPFKGMFEFQGLTMELNDTISFEDEAADLIEQGTLKRDNTLYIESIDTLTHEVQFVLETFYKEDDIKRLTMKVFSDYLTQATTKEETEKILNECKFEVYVICRTWIDLDNGWATYSKLTRVSHVVAGQHEFFKDEVITMELMDQ